MKLCGECLPALERAAVFSYERDGVPLYVCTKHASAVVVGGAAAVRLAELEPDTADTLPAPASEQQPPLTSAELAELRCMLSWFKGPRP